MKKLFLFAIAIGLLTSEISLAAKGEWFAYIGTYTRGKSKGIYAYRFNEATGAVTEVGLVAETSNPSFLVVAPNQQFLYAVNENSMYEGQRAGSVSAFAIDRTSGKLKHLNTVSSKGPGPCHIAFDQKGKWLIVSNYGGGSVTVHPVKPDGSVGESSAFIQHSGPVALPQRQGGPHAHYATVTPDNKYVMVADLGLDQMVVYKLDPTKGTLTPHDPPFAKTAPGTGPRHGAFHPDGKFFYVMTEIVPGVTAFRYDKAKGSMESIQSISSLPEGDATPNKSGAELMMHPSGKFLYASNRGPNTIAAFKIDPKDGKLTAGERTPTGGRTPRSFGIDPSGQWLFAANQDTDNIIVFKIDRNTGALTKTEKTLEVGAPVSVVFSAIQ